MLEIGVVKWKFLKLIVGSQLYNKVLSLWQRLKRDN